MVSITLNNKKYQGEVALLSFSFLFFFFFEVVLVHNNNNNKKKTKHLKTLNLL